MPTEEKSATEGDPTVLALDAGQTAIKARLERPGLGTAERLFPGIRTHEPLFPQLAHVARVVADDEGTDVDAVTAGVSGLTRHESDAAGLHALLKDITARVILAHDSVTSFLGARGDGTGAVIAAGTGVVTLGVGRSRVARVDGWGNIMGDAGSGYWIGREALDAVMRAHDGRGPHTSLTAIVTPRWADLESAYIELQAAPDRVSVVASFAKAVAEEAATDEVSARICRRAASELAVSATAALKRVREPDEKDAPVVCALGGVFGSDLIRREFEDRVRETYPDVRFEPSHGTGIDGAVALAHLSPSHALLSYVSTSG